jgi:hypothetical protein
LCKEIFESTTSEIARDTFLCGLRHLKVLLLEVHSECSLK